MEVQFKYSTSIARPRQRPGWKTAARVASIIIVTAHAKNNHRHSRHMLTRVGAHCANTQSTARTNIGHGAYCRTTCDDKAQAQIHESEKRISVSASPIAEYSRESTSERRTYKLSLATSAGGKETPCAAWSAAVPVVAAGAAVPAAACACERDTIKATPAIEGAGAARCAASAAADAAASSDG